MKRIVELVPPRWVTYISFGVITIAISIIRHNTVWIFGGG